MKLRFDTILASFVVALFSSFIVALAALLVKALAISFFDRKLFADLTINLLILFFLGGVVFFKGSSLAAWLLYRHDVAWGYKIEFKQIAPILLISLIMATAVFFAVYFYSTGKIEALAYLEKSAKLFRTGHF